jgi:methylenetetrahydrofolate--tRNA-(uracil-5-)-methyltransferase
MKQVAVIGGGLAGTEASYQLAKRNIKVTLFEMRPITQTSVHETPFLGELVCSNSLGSIDISTASGLLKKELKELDSFYLKIAENFKVPAGNSFSIDRHVTAKQIEKNILSNSNITVIRKEITSIPQNYDAVIVATGPLTSGIFSEEIIRLTKRRHLYFYDATSPVIRADSIDLSPLFFASRYDKGTPDFINIPLTKDEYDRFVYNLISAECVPLHDVDKAIYYESCLPIEEIARRGHQTLAFGPLKPIGLINPQTSTPPYAVVQLRQDDLHKCWYQMVGFQTRLKYSEQQRVFSSLPGLQKAIFERYGRMHRNSYINAPLLLNRHFQFKQIPNLFFAGQISGVEGYVESIASGLSAAISLTQFLHKKPIKAFPAASAIGSLSDAIAHSNWESFRPTNFTMGLLPNILKEKNESKADYKKKRSIIALESLKEWIHCNNI